MITTNRFRRLEAALRRRGYGATIEWSQSIGPPASAEAFAFEAIYAVINAGMKVTVAEIIYGRCIAALGTAGSVSAVFGHPGKAKAINTLWRDRQRLFAEYLGADDQLTFLAALPWIGPVTVNHLAKNLGHDLAKADRHLERLARRDRTTTAKLCRRLAAATGHRVASVDSIIWRACADGLLNSRTYEREGWTAAISADVTKEAWIPIAEKS